MSALALWQNWILASGFAATTAHDWPNTVERACRATGRDPMSLTTEDIASYLAAQRTPNTRQAYYNALASWHRWLLETGRREDNPMAQLRRPRVPRGTPRPVSTANLQRLLATPLRPKTRVAIILAAYAGLRVHEIAKFRGEDLDRDERVLLVTGKGGVTYRLPAADPILVATEIMPTHGYWYPGPSGGHVVSRTMTARITNAMRKAGIPGTPHALRHWYATHLLREGADAVTVQELMRHASLATTQVYVKADPERRRDAVLRLPDLTLSA